MLWLVKYEEEGSCHQLTEALRGPFLFHFCGDHEWSCAHHQLTEESQWAKFLLLHIGCVVWVGNQTFVLLGCWILQCYNCPLTWPQLINKIYFITFPHWELTLLWNNLSFWRESISIVRSSNCWEVLPSKLKENLLSHHSPWLLTLPSGILRGKTYASFYMAALCIIWQLS